MSFPTVSSNDSTDDMTRAIVEYASQNRMIGLCYSKYAGDNPYRRVVEPYRFQDHCGNMMVQTYQVDPRTGDSTQWRNFRLDRIQSLGDGGSNFQPRCQVTICNGEVHAFNMDDPDPVAQESPAFAYRKALDAAVRDGKLTGDEINQLRAMQVGVINSFIRGAHARIYYGILGELVADGAINSKEDNILKQTRKALEALGWSP